MTGRVSNHLEHPIPFDTSVAARPACRVGCWTFRPTFRGKRSPQRGHGRPRLPHATIPPAWCSSVAVYIYDPPDEELSDKRGGGGWLLKIASHCRQSMRLVIT